MDIWCPVFFKLRQRNVAVLSDHYMAAISNKYMTVYPLSMRRLYLSTMGGYIQHQAPIQKETKKSIWRLYPISKWQYIRKLCGGYIQQLWGGYIQ